MLLRFTLFVIKRSVNVISSEPPFIESNVRFTIVLKIFVWSNMNYLPMIISLKIWLFSTVVSLKKWPAYFCCRKARFGIIRIKHLSTYHYIKHLSTYHYIKQLSTYHYIDQILRVLLWIGLPYSRSSLTKVLQGTKKYLKCLESLAQAIPTQPLIKLKPLISRFISPQSCLL